MEVERYLVSIYLLLRRVGEFKDLRWTADIKAEEYIKSFNEKIRFIEQESGAPLSSKYKLHLFMVDLRERDEEIATRLLDTISNDWKKDDAKDNLNRVQEYVKSSSQLNKVATTPDQARNGNDTGGSANRSDTKDAKSSVSSSSSSSSW